MKMANSYLLFNILTAHTRGDEFHQGAGSPFIHLCVPFLPRVSLVFTCFVKYTHTHE